MSETTNVQELNDMLSYALTENEKLMAENRRLNQLVNMTTNRVYPSKENTVVLRLPSNSVCRPFYPTEAYELVVNVLQQASLSYCGEKNVRCTELLNALIQENPVHGDRLEWEKEVSNILSGNQGLNNTDIRDLRSLGFDVRDGKDGKGHWTISYGGMKRYRFTAPSTPSDWRSMKNLAAEVISKLTVYKNPQLKHEYPQMA